MAFFLLPVAMLSACDRSGDEVENQPGVVANIVDKGAVAPAPSRNAAPVMTEDEKSQQAGSRGLIPVAIQGQWAGVADRCGDPSAALDLNITPDRLIFHESEGKVEAVEAQADGRYAVRAAFTGEGQSWTRTLMLRIDGGQLIIANDGEAVTRKRC